MCGIFGFCRLRGSESRGLDAKLLQSATYSLAHRGPDSKGLVGWTIGGDLLKDGNLNDQILHAGLGHCRLAILDLTSAGQQPMNDANGNWIVFNGEIFNYKAIRSDLKSLGFEFKTRTDTEVILAAYAAWGENCINRFNGMWAFALFDVKKQIIFASRDRLGIKPFYYALDAHRFIFSSEIRPFFHHPDIRPQIERNRLIRYLVDCRIDDGPDTIYADIRELRGGHNLIVEVNSGKHAINRFWSLPQGPDLDLSDEDALDRYADLIEDAVRLRLNADVPVALTLSGGIDSSVIALAASRVSNSALHTFTSRFPEHGEIDESVYAKAVAESCRIDPIFIEPSLSRMMEEEPSLTLHQEMPYRSLSLYVHWLILSQIRSDGFPVVLSGQGGDELFCGYERYHVNALLSKYPNIIKILSDFFQAGANSGIGYARLFAYIAYFSNSGLQRYIRRWNAKRVYHHDFLNQLPNPQQESVADMRALQASEIEKYCLPTLLRYDDRTSGGLAVETRTPFLDYRIVEFAYQLPLRHKIRNGWTKYISRRYLARHIPSFIAWRRKKLGFDAPHEQWSHALLREKGRRLQETPFAAGLLSPGLQMEDIRGKQVWDVYNTLHLAELLKWSWKDS